MLHQKYPSLVDWTRYLENFTQCKRYQLNTVLPHTVLSLIIVTKYNSEDYFISSYAGALSSVVKRFSV